MLRIDPGVHAQAAMQAEAEGKSLNAWAQETLQRAITLGMQAVWGNPILTSVLATKILSHFRQFEHDIYLQSLFVSIRRQDCDKTPGRFVQCSLTIN